MAIHREGYPFKKEFGDNRIDLHRSTLPLEAPVDFTQAALDIATPAKPEIAPLTAEQIPGVTATLVTNMRAELLEEAA